MEICPELTEASHTTSQVPFKCSEVKQQELLSKFCMDNVFYKDHTEGHSDIPSGWHQLVKFLLKANIFTLQKCLHK